ncbi:SGNH/GDSL hydrolase family protein [Candidatus Peregrinibacteria bacterium]|nr:SGNH/GDSL hydrolase family protein [Candidatus Peregrinibacteria bacterium]
MQKQKLTPKAADDFLSQLGDLFGPVDTGLDQAKKNLEAHREELEKLRKAGQLDKLAINFWLTYAEGIRADLRENGVTSEAAQQPVIEEIKAAWEQKQMGKKAEVILSCPELKAIDEFNSIAENLPKAREIIESAEPQQKWQAMLTNWASGIPGLGKLLEGSQFSSFLSSIGLGFLLPASKKEQKQKEEGKEKKGAEEQVAEKKDKEKEKGRQEGAETVKLDSPLDDHEVIPEDFKPGKTLVMGDSNYEILRLLQQKELKERVNATVLAKGSEQTHWGIMQIKGKPKSYFADFENVVISFGTNDMGGNETGPDVWSRFEKIIALLKEKNPNMRILMATIPPGKGNKAGAWGSNFDKGEPTSVETKRAYVNEQIRKAKNKGVVHGLIDLAAKRSKGGVADDQDPAALHAEYSRTKGDPIHIKADVLAEAVLRAQYEARDIEVA